MLLSGIPGKFPVPFAKSAGSGFIRPVPTASQIGITNGAASLTDGFPPLNFQPLGAGGVPPYGQDMNGILNQISAWTQWQNAGGTVPYDPTFQAQISGYPKGAVVASVTTVGLFWYCMTDSNLSNPDAGGAGWLAWQVLGALAANILFQTFVATGTYTIPTSTIKIIAVGAGGGGNINAGGGAGASLTGYITGLTVGATLAVTIGAGGSGNAGSGAGTNGTATTLTSGSQTIATLTAGAGHFATGSSAGIGGTATGGQVNQQGNGGQALVGGIGQPYGPFGNGGGVAGNGVVVNGVTLTNQNAAQGIMTIEAVG